MAEQQIYSKKGNVILLSSFIKQLHTFIHEATPNPLRDLLGEYQDVDIALGSMYRDIIQTVRTQLIQQNSQKDIDRYSEMLEILLENIPIKRRTEKEIDELEMLYRETAPLSETERSVPFAPSSSPVSPIILITNARGEKHPFDDREWYYIEAMDERHTNVARKIRYHTTGDVLNDKNLRICHKTKNRRFILANKVRPPKPTCISRLTESLNALQLPS